MIRESRFSPPRVGCPHPELWTAMDEQATEREVIDGLYGLVRMLQPEFVVETGTHRGFAAEAMGRALRDNGHGRLVTIEIEEELARLARQKVHGLPVTVLHGSSLDFEPDEPVDFAWFDSGDQIRKAEFELYFPKMHNRTVVAFHDTFVGETTVSVVTSQVAELAEERKLFPCFMPTPRGIAICRVLK